MPVTPDRPAPYAPTSTVLDVITRYRERGLPTPVNRDVLARAGIPETLSPRVLQTLQTLDLIDEGGQPTAAFEGIRRAAAGEYQQRLAEWLNAAYADALNYVDPANADEVAVRDAFRNYNPVGQQARMVSLFLGLYAAAGIGAERPAQQSRPQARVSTQRTRASTGATSNQKRWSPTHREQAHLQAGLPPALAGLMASLPRAGDGWTQETRDKFVKLFGITLDFCFPIVTQADIDNRNAAEQ